MGLRFIAGSPIVRASLIGVAVINFFNLMFEALFMLYAVRALGVSPGLLGVVIGAGAIGGVLGSVMCKWLTSRLGAGSSTWPGASCSPCRSRWCRSPRPRTRMLMLLMLFASCFASGFGVMVLDISIAAISGVVIPDMLRSRVAGAYQAINYGTRPAGALLGGLLGTALGLRPALWIAVAGGVFGSILLLPSPLLRFRMPTVAARLGDGARDGSVGVTKPAAFVRDDGFSCGRSLLKSTSGRMSSRRRRGRASSPGRRRGARRATAGRGGAATRGHGRCGDRRAGAVARAAGGAGAVRGGRGRGGAAGERLPGGGGGASAGRLAGFATLPTGSPADAAEELSRCVIDLGFAGGLINSTIG